MRKHLTSRPSAEWLRHQEFDVAIIGGGITGAGIAQDAALRGLRVILFEKGDFASGTSSKSTKLIHGGLRYLKNGQVGVVRESLRERQLQMHLAPHMVWSLPFVVPTYRGRFFNNLSLGVGLWVYDLLAGFRNRNFHKRISAEEVLRLCPGVQPEGLTGGYLYEDCRTDDARHTLEVLRSAREAGAIVVNHAEVTGLMRGPIYGNAQGLRVDLLEATGRRATVRVKAHVIVNSTGVWTAQLASQLGMRSRTTVVPAKGIHITVAKSTLPINSAMIVPSAHDNRFCFAVPWYDSVVIGTTDTEYTGDLDNVRAEPHEIQYVLDAVNKLFPHARLTPDHVTGSFAGLRPLIKDPRKSSTAELSRGHALDVTYEGVITIAGGKLTTYRPMAESVVDVVCQHLRRRRDAPVIGPKRTHLVRLGGWSHDDNVPELMAQLKQEALDLGLDESTASYLPTAYGKRTSEVLEFVRGQRHLSEKVSPNHPYIMAQVVYAVLREGALTIDDVLSRRIRLSITDAAAAREAGPRIAHIMGPMLGWRAETYLAQLHSFEARIGA